MTHVPINLPDEIVIKFIHANTWFKITQSTWIGRTIIHSDQPTTNNLYPEVTCSYISGDIYRQ